jgi:predicted Zn-dependent peptidase
LAIQKLDKLQPKFIDFEIDLDQYKIGMLEVIAKENTDNDLFSLTYLFDFGKNLDHILPLATEFMDYVGTDDMSPEEVKQEFYKLGANMSLNVGGNGNQTFITLSGLSETMKPAMQLFEKLLQKPVGSKDALDKLIERILKARKDIQKNKGVILQRQMYAYAKYGKDNPLTDIITTEELKQIKHKELTQRIQNLSSFPHRILYYGNQSINELTDLVTSHHNVPQTFNEIDDVKKYTEKDYDTNQVFWSHFDMVQTEIILLSKLEVLNNTKTAAIQMFNQYFGAGMNSIVFQEIREAQGLAYSVYSAYRQATKKNESDYLFSYIGIQSDKQKEALGSMLNLINNLPKSPQAFNIGKQAILNRIESERITKKNVLNSYLAAEKKGLDVDIREQIYDEVKAMNYNNLLEFHKKYVGNKSHNILLIGNRNNIDFKNLKQYGKIQELSLETLFGY